MLELARLGVATRPGWQPEESSDRIEVFELEPHPVSSTDDPRARAAWRADRRARRPAVAAYIAGHDLYRDA